MGASLRTKDPGIFVPEFRLKVFHLHVMPVCHSLAARARSTTRAPKAELEHKRKTTQAMTGKEGIIKMPHSP